MPLLPARGATLAEMIVALLVLEVAGLLALSAALQIGRVRERLDRGAAVDLARLDTLALHATDSSCRNAAAPRAESIALAAAIGRPLQVALVSCGR